MKRGRFFSIKVNSVKMVQSRIQQGISPCKTKPDCQPALKLLEHCFAVEMT